MSWTLGFNGLRAGDDPGDRSAVPDDLAVTGQAEIGIGSGGQRLGPAGELAGDRLERGRPDRLGRCGIALGKKAKTDEAADECPLDKDPAIFLDARHHIFLLPQAAHQHAGAAVDKTLSEAFMQGVRETILDAAGPQLPMEGVGKPVGGWR